MALPNTHFGTDKIAQFLAGGKKNIYFCGIGGVSMCSLAHITHLRGHRVSGYDRTPSALTHRLEELGIDVHYTADTSHIDGADMLVYTVAIPATQPEYAEALKRGIPVVSRADYLGYIMCGYKKRIGVSGMHGKSTTTSMLEQIFRIGGKDPTVSCGAPMKDVGGRCDRIGAEDYFIFEACEYMDSFLDFYPTDVIVLNIEPDHLDYFRDLDHIEDSFSRFLDRAGIDGTAYLNVNDDNVMRAAKDYSGRIVTFGVETPSAAYSATDIVMEHGRPSFTVLHNGVGICRISMHVPGAHNVCDALAASAVALEHGISPDALVQALAEFDGAVRRMDRHGATPKGAIVFDDYAHHPTEISSTLSAAAQMEHNRIFCVFQPHTYSRTKELFDDFAAALAHKDVYQVVLAEIYSARETDTLGVSSSLLADAVTLRGGNCTALPTFDAIVDHLSNECCDGDLILVMGAGDINLICRKLVQ